MPRLPVALVFGLVVAILGAASVVSAKASLDEATREHDRAVAERLPRLVELAFEKRGIPLESARIDAGPLDIAPPIALEYPAARLPGNNCFAIYVYEEQPNSLVSGRGRVACQEILRQHARRGAPPTSRGTLVGNHYLIIYSLQPRLVRLVESALAAAVRADH